MESGINEDADVSIPTAEGVNSAEEPKDCYRLLVSRLVEYFNRTGRSEVPSKGLELSVIAGLSSWTVRKALKYAEFQLNQPFARTITREDAIQRANALKSAKQ